MCHILGSCKLTALTSYKNANAFFLGLTPS